MRINRRTLLAGAGALAASSTNGAPAVARAAKPNILFVVIDDANNFNEYQGGYPGIKTPHMKAAAEQWCGFTRSFTAAPYCQSSRHAMLFGRQPFVSGSYDQDAADWYENPNLKSLNSIVRYFKLGGFKTIGTGKVFHDGWRPINDNPAHSDSSAYDVFQTKIGDAYFEGGGLEVNSAGPIDIENARMEDVWRTNWMIENVLRKTHTKPFFATLGLRKTHIPLKVSRKHWNAYKAPFRDHPGVLDSKNKAMSTNDDMKDLPPAGIQMAQKNYDFYRKLMEADVDRKWLHSYLSCYSAVDECIGMLRSNLPEDTIVCIVSDHGWHLYDKVNILKFTLWEQACLVPTIIGGAGLREGKTDALFSLVDVFDTLTNLAGIPSKRNGVSHAAFLRGGSKQAREHVVTSWRFGGKLRFAVRDREYRGIFYGDGQFELYDHRVGAPTYDPYEWRNIAPGNKAILDRLALKLPANPVPQVNKKSKTPARD